MENGANQATETQVVETQEVETQATEAEESELEQVKALLEAEKAARKVAEESNKKTKAALDKALHDVGKLTKENRAKMTDAEREAAKRQEEWDALVEKNAELERYRQTNMAKERYMLRGMPVDLATKAAEAEVAGNMEELSDIEQQYHDAEMKAAEAEWKKSRPPVSAGSGSTPMTKEEILAMDDRVKQLEAIAMNLELFKN